MKRKAIGVIFAALSCFSACQWAGNTPGAMGSLSFNVQWPATDFTTQLIPSETQDIVVAIFDQGMDKPPQIVRLLPKDTSRLIISAIPVGTKAVLSLALDENHNILTGEHQSTDIEANQRKAMAIDLQLNPLSDMNTDEKVQIQALIDSLFPEAAPSPTPQTSTSGPDVSQPNPEAPPNSTEDPSGTPDTTTEATPLADSTASPAPSSSPSATPSSNPSPSSNSSGSSGGGSSSATPTPTPTPVEINVGSEGGDVQTDITIEDGAPRSDTIGIE